MSRVPLRRNHAWLLLLALTASVGTTMAIMSGVALLMEKRY